MTTLAALAAKIAASGLTRDTFAAIAAADLDSSDDLQAVLSVGDALRAVNQLALAARCYARARVLAPQIAEIPFIQADVAQLLGDTEAARETFAQLSAIPQVSAPLREIARLKAACVLPQVIASEDQIRHDRARIAAALEIPPSAAVSDLFTGGGFTNFYLAYQGENDRDLQQALARAYLRLSPALAFEAPPVRTPFAGKRIRLGLLSRHFFEHTIAYLNHGLIHGLDRDRFELVLIRVPSGLAPDDTARTMAAAADRVVDLPLDLAKARAQIAALALDVLHYPDLGMDTLGYFLAFARLARVQTVGWGHPVTTGIPTIDAFLSVDAMEPAGATDHYTEQLIRLTAPVPAVPRPPTPAIADPAAFGIDAARPVYLCPQSLFKAHPAFDEIAARLLAKDPAGIIYFVGLWEPLNSTFRARLGKAGDRIRIIPRVSTAQFPALLSCADVILDIPQWSGGKTSLEALAQGIPIVHWPGRFMRGRHTLAFYRQMGIMDCVADGVDDYVARAVRLVHDTAFRKRVRGEIAARSAGLFDQMGAVRETEDLWIKMLGRIPP